MKDITQEEIDKFIDERIGHALEEVDGDDESPTARVVTLVVLGVLELYRNIQDMRAEAMFFGVEPPELPTVANLIAAGFRLGMAAERAGWILEYSDEDSDDTLSAQS